MADKWTPDENSSYSTRFTNWITRGALGETGTQLAGAALYSLPVIGQALALADTAQSIKRGDYGTAALNALMILPAAGYAKTGLKMLQATGRLGKVGKTFTNTTKALQKIDNAGKKYSSLKFYIPASIGNEVAKATLPSMYDNWVNGGGSSPRSQSTEDDQEFYKELKTRIEQNIKDARSKGYSDSEIQSAYGDNWGEVQRLLNSNF